MILIVGLGAGGISAQDAPKSELESLRQEIEELRRRDAAREAELARLKFQVEALLRAVGPAAAAGGSAAARPAPPAPAPPAPESDQAALDAALQAPAETAGTAAPAAAGSPPRPAPAADASRPAGFLNLVNLSLDGMVAAGGSTATDDELADLEGGGHDPNRRGFTFQQAEISLMGAVDPYFAAEAHIVFTSGGVELEEAFAATQALPAGLQVKAGYFLSEFGRMNPTHPHAWSWLDQPVIATRLFGPDGMRSAGLRAGWLAPLPWYSEFQVTLQDASGETMPSFLASPSTGEAGHAHSKSAGFLLPVPGLVLHEEEGGEGRHRNRRAASPGPGGGEPRGPGLAAALEERLGLLAGGVRPVGDLRHDRPQLHRPGRPHLAVRHRPGGEVAAGGQPARLAFPDVGAELMARQYRASAFFDDDDPDQVIDLPEETLKDWGFYSQVLYGFRYLWAAGVRVEHASGSGESVGGRENDPYRDNRFRFSPLLVWQPSEFSRLRFQYNYDRADHLAARMPTPSGWAWNS